MTDSFYIARLRDTRQREVCAVIRRSDGHPIFSAETRRECVTFIRLISKHLYNSKEVAA